jgi:hypothetical protein
MSGDNYTSHKAIQKIVMATARLCLQINETYLHDKFKVIVDGI